MKTRNKPSKYPAVIHIRVTKEDKEYLKAFSASELRAKLMQKGGVLIARAPIPRKSEIQRTITSIPSWACEAYDVRVKGCEKNEYAEVTQEMCAKCKANAE
jgi:hypothetical protein